MRFFLAISQNIFNLCSTSLREASSCWLLSIKVVNKVPREGFFPSFFGFLFVHFIVFSLWFGVFCSGSFFVLVVFFGGSFVLGWGLFVWLVGFGFFVWFFGCFLGIVFVWLRFFVWFGFWVLGFFLIFPEASVLLGG